MASGPPPKSVCDLPASCPALVVDASTRITLERSGCFGRCPVYTVTIAGDGTVTWQGTAHVDVGSDTAKIPVAKVQELADFLSSSCFFSMQDRYSRDPRRSRQSRTDERHAMLPAEGAREDRRAHRRDREHPPYYFQKNGTKVFKPECVR